MNDYARVARKLHTVRRAWKRAAALGGFAVIFLDAVGLFTIALLLDLLYRPRLPMRVGIFAVAAAGILYLLARHVVAPLLRRIGDQRLALFVEEHDARFEGALIAAAEFRSAEHLAGRQAQLVDEIIAAAAARAQRIDLRKVIDLSRLKKYGVAALVVVLFYGGVGLLFPGTAGRHAARVLTPGTPRPRTAPRPGPRPSSCRPSSSPSRDTTRASCAAPRSSSRPRCRAPPTSRCCCTSEPRPATARPAGDTSP